MIDLDFCLVCFVYTCT
uniref:Uncharacterized protein n=1 Tax=Rhizophora mucronata TaxID=61149 RepID=A0A2P2IJ41_RHIMU